MLRIAAEDYLEALAAHGIEHLFVNPGTDFAPIVEAYSRAARTNRPVPKPLVVPHENAAVAHGARLHHGHRQTTGDDAAHQCWHRERNQHADQRQPRPRADAADLGTHAVHRTRRRRIPQRAHPMGAGDVRSGRNAAGNGQMGLRNEARRPGRIGRRARHRNHQRITPRSRLSKPAARGSGRSHASRIRNQSRPVERSRDRRKQRQATSTPSPTGSPQPEIP